jgi:Spy/CpxP family protein refolding chaperone
MKKNLLHALKLFGYATVLLTLVGAMSLSVRAQDNPPPPQDQPNDQPNRPLPDLGRALGLNPDQMRQLWAINQRTAPEFRRARQRVQQAREELDIALYGDVVDENNVNAKIEELNQAQSEMERLKTMREFRIRQLLSPDQLAILRGIRRRALQMMNGERPRDPGDGNQPFRPNDRRGNQPGQNNEPPPGNNFTPHQKQPAKKN